LKSTATSSQKLRSLTRRLSPWSSTARPGTWRAQVTDPPRWCLSDRRATHRQTTA
jgi:hypothetical protein